MEILKHYVVLNQYTGLLINDKKQGIHYINREYSYVIFNYLDDNRNGLVIEIDRATGKIHNMSYYQGNMLHGKSLKWCIRRLYLYQKFSNDDLHGMSYRWYKEYLVSINLYNSFMYDN